MTTFAQTAPAPAVGKITIEYDDHTVRQFLIAAVVWGLVGMAAGVLVATQLSFWQANFNLPWLTFGRLRPLHTNAAIFAFVGNMMFAGIYYSTQRLVKARTASDLLSKIHFWGWQGIIVAAAITLPLGFSRGKEYAELIWPINIAVAVIWVVFAINFFWTLARRNEPSLYVAIWFYIATIITVAVLYIVNHLQIPTSWTHGYPIFGGVQDALVQWWYGHNAVAFFLTTPILGIMYYYLPKAANRPVYSYRLSIVHFWSLVFVYIWAGPHHLLYTALPGWLQALGMLFSIMLWAPSWGGMLNGLLTLKGAWHKLRTDPVLKFFAAGVTFYGMATFEGPLLSIKAVNSLSHYTDWTIGHVHAGTLGWNGFMAAGMFYWLAPRLWRRRDGRSVSDPDNSAADLHSVPMANMHFWLGLVGILLYVASMWVSGVMQGLMLNATTDDGTSLAYPNFLEALTAAQLMMIARAVGGTLYLIGFCMLGWNIWKTIRRGEAVNGVVEVAPRVRDKAEHVSMGETFLNAPVVYTFLMIAAVLCWGFGNDVVSFAGLVGVIVNVAAMFVHKELSGATWGGWYEKLLSNALPFTVLTVLAVLAGGLVEITPTVIMNTADSVKDVRQAPYTPLELAGRDIYIREGCYNCHSQMIRPFVSEVLRYGDYSKLGESIYDRPFQWGSKRTGPDLARVGGKYPHVWHYKHMQDPRSTSAGSNMPNYPWLFMADTDVNALPAKLSVMRKLGVPMPLVSREEILDSVNRQAGEIAADLQQAGVEVRPEAEIVALIAYLQQLGNAEPVAQTASAP